VLICALVYVVGFGSALLFLKSRGSVAASAQYAPIEVSCPPGGSARKALSDEARAQVRALRDGAR
jgi:hypothetical protein